MRIAYIFLWRIAKPDGVSKKIRGQIEAWKREGHEVLAICLTDEHELGGDEDFELVCFRTDAGLGKRIGSEREARRSIESRLAQFTPDVVYMRQTAQVRLVEMIGRAWPLVFEINSEELSQMRLVAGESRRWKDWARLLLVCLM